jgi:leukotriene-A4 hydrolase
MAPSQTSNKKYPYMFSQCQAIHNRSIFPCQDTPDVKSTYEFKIRSPLPVIASGLSTGATLFEHGENGEFGTLQYSFLQEIPMPSYLFALASGDIATASIGPRSLVSTGPEELAEAKWELEADTEKFIEVAEKLIYSYKWTQYNVLVLPPSFPYGGMENPV